MTVFISQRYANFAALNRLDLNGTFGTYIAFTGAASLSRLIETVKPACVFVQGPDDEHVVRLAEQWTSTKMERWKPPSPPDPPKGGEAEELKAFGDAISKAMVDSGDFTEITTPKPAKRRKAA